MMRWMLTVLAVVTLSACSWVELTEKGENVRVMSAEQVGNCERLGKTTVRTKGSAIGLERHEEKVQAELDTLARNSAPDIGGDTVVRMGSPEDGVQVYDVYRCLR